MDGRVHGIDVSHWDGVVDWSAAAAAGVQFAFAKATQGADPGASGYTDGQFANNWAAMADAGVIRAAYHFIGLPLPNTPVVNWNVDLHSQIDHFLEVVGPLQDGDLPPVLDIENGDSPARWNALIKTNRSGALDIVRELINYTTAQLGGVIPILYTGSFWWSDLGNPDDTDDDMPFGAYPLWMAQYPQVHDPLPLPSSPGKTDMGEAGSFAEYALKLDGHILRHIPTIWGGSEAPQWAFWQFSEFGLIPELASGYFDLDVFNGSLDQLNALCIGA